MKQDLLSSGSQASVVDVALLPMMMVMCDEEDKICGLCYPSSSRHSMCSTCGPRDIISLVTPRLGDGGGNSTHHRFISRILCIIFFINILHCIHQISQVGVNSSGICPRDPHKTSGMCPNNSLIKRARYL
jgi:hypothetical protein